MALTLLEAQAQQALAEGFQSGPTPVLNPQNVSTQQKLGNVLVPTAEPAPYYPGVQSTPLLNLSLEGLSESLANNFVLLDGSAVTVPPEGRLQVVNANTPQSVSSVAPITTLYTVSIYVASYGDGAPGSTLVTTIDWIAPSGSHRTITLSLVGNVDNIQMEQYPIFVGAGQTITVTTTFSTTPFHYDASIRLVQFV